MAYEERNVWVGLIVSLLSVAVYIWLVLSAAGGGPLADVDWVPFMVWTIVGGLVVSIGVSFLWGRIVARRHPDDVGTSDQRDRDISHMSTRVGQAFLLIAGLGVLVLCAFEADWFWIANTMYAGFALSSIIGCIASVIAYRRGLV
jgi:hypothetical protein